MMFFAHYLNEMTSRILVVAAHPDDEVLGCGGTIARHADAGDQVQVLILAEGATSRQRQRDRGLVIHELSVLAQAAHKAGAILGAAGVELLDLPDNRLDSMDRLDLIKQIEGCIDRHQPQMVDPRFVELFKSRGIETVEHKLFMRLTGRHSHLTC